MRKGFTLIELLAVIIILAIIALIVSPTVIKIIDGVKKDAFKNSAYSIVRSADLLYTQALSEGSGELIIFTYENGVETSSVEGKSLEYTGDKPQSGNVVINEDGDVAIAFYNGEYCAEKSFNESTIELTTKTEEECMIDLNDFIHFAVKFGGTGNESFSNVIKVDDGYIAVGDASSTDGDLQGNSITFYYDSVIAKYDLNGNLLWCNTYGVGDSYEYFRDVIKVDDGYIAVGFSTDDATMYDDAVLVKFDLNGNIVWDRTYGGSDYDSFSSIEKIEDGYIVTGYTYSVDGDLRDVGETGDAFIIKYDNSDNVVWRKNYGGSNSEGFGEIIIVDNGYIVVGTNSSTDGNLITANNGGRDAIISKFDLNGDLLWCKNYGGTNNEGFSYVLSVEDGYVVTGTSSYYDAGFHQDAIIVKYDTSGNLLWDKSYGGTGRDGFGSPIETNEGYLVVGVSDSIDGDLSGLNKGDMDAIIVEYDTDGNVISKENYGGSGRDSFSRIIKVGSEHVVVGNSISSDGDFADLNITDRAGIIIKDLFN